MSLSFLSGAAVVVLDVPPADFLRKAFDGARAWYQRSEARARVGTLHLPKLTMGKVDSSEKTFDGFTLLSAASIKTSSTQPFVINMRGDVVHRWGIPFRRAFPDASHFSETVEDALVSIFGCHLYSNGDLLCVFHAPQEQSHTTEGLGLAKLDRDSNVLWTYPARVHHNVDVGPDGTIYAIYHERVDHMPKGLEFIPAPALVDFLVLLSPDGKPLIQPISILEAVHDSPYASLLSSPYEESEPGEKHALSAAGFAEVRKKDPLHTNHIQLLTSELAPKFPQFSAGQVLLTLRHLNAVAVLDLQKRSVVWAATGPWRAQHAAQFLDNGRLLIFDNLGWESGSRILEYDPPTKSITWSFSTEGTGPFVTADGGICQRLPNGNTLIVDAEHGTVFEVTYSKEVVWSAAVDGFLSTAWRYSADELPFLKGAPRARP
jgi:hypothetical protein